MVWVKLDDAFVSHPRMVRAGKDGRSLFIAGLCYCGAHLTDGRIPKGVVRMLAAQAEVSARTALRLVEVGSWIEHGEEYEVHDFLVYNPSREKVLGDREAGAERQRLSRSRRAVTSSVTDGVSTRDPSRPVPIDNSSPNGFDSHAGESVEEKNLGLVLEAFADMQGKRSKVNHSPQWRNVVIANARAEHADTIRRWQDEFDLPAQRLAAGLIDGPHPTWGQHRRSS